MVYNIALIPGDGIGPSVVAEATKVLTQIGKLYSHVFKFVEVDAGGIAIDKYGEPLPNKSVEICKSCDAVILGAVGGEKWDTLPGHLRPERALLGLRGELGLFANLRPAKLYDELRSACPLREDIAQRGIDFIIVRELTGGMYFGDRGRKQSDLGMAAWDTEQYAEKEVERLARVGFELAMKRNKHLTNVDKANVLESSRLWREVVLQVAKEYPEVKLDHMYVDNASMQLIKMPDFFDVIVTTNMFGDILSDEASQITGSIGMLPSASLGTTGKGKTFGLYEPIHGSAPDIAGLDLANPIASILSVSMMLRDSFGLLEEATAIDRAVLSVLSKNYRTADIYSSNNQDMIKVGTVKMGDLIAAEL